jgi:hypothetical protein
VLRFVELEWRLNWLPLRERDASEFRQVGVIDTCHALDRLFGQDVALERAHAFQVDQPNFTTALLRLLHSLRPDRRKDIAREAAQGEVDSQHAVLPVQDVKFVPRASGDRQEPELRPSRRLGLHLGPSAYVAPALDLRLPQHGVALASQLSYFDLKLAQMRLRESA